MTFPSRYQADGSRKVFKRAHTFLEFLLSLPGDRSLPRVAGYNIRVLESWKPVGIIEFIRLVFIIPRSISACKSLSLLLIILPSFLPSFGFSEEPLGSLVPFAALYLSSSSVCVIANGISISICLKF